MLGQPCRQEGAPELLEGCQLQLLQIPAAPGTLSAILPGCLCLQTFINLCQQPVAQYLDRFGFKSDLLKAMYAVTDGFAGLTGSWESPGSGMNFLVHNMVSSLVCRLFSGIQHGEQPGLQCVSWCTTW